MTFDMVSPATGKEGDVINLSLKGLAGECVSSIWLIVLVLNYRAATRPEQCAG